MADQRDQLRIILENDLRVARYFYTNDYTDWEDTYEGLAKRHWLFYFQSRYPKIETVAGQKKTSYYSLYNPKEFLYYIEREIRKNIENLGQIPSSVQVGFPSNIPQNLASLVAELGAKKLQNASERKIRKNLSTDIGAVQSALIHQWEVERQNYLQSTLTAEQQKHTAIIQANTASALTTFATRAPGVLDNPTKIAAISQTIADKISEATRQQQGWDTLPTASLSQQLSSSLDAILRQTDVSTLPQTLQTEIKNTVLSGTVGQDLINRISSFSKLEQIKKSSADYQTHLAQKLTTGSPTPYQPNVDPANISRIYTVNYLNSVYDKISSDLASDFGLGKSEIDSLRNQALFTIERAVTSSAIQRMPYSSQEEIHKFIQEAVYQTLVSQIGKLASVNKPRLLGIFVSDEGKQKAEAILQRVTNDIQNPPPEVLSSLTNTAFSNFSINKKSLEGGDPLGRVPLLIQLEFLKRIKNPEQIDNWFNRLVLDTKEDPNNPGRFIPLLKQNQITALENLAWSLKQLEQNNPALASLLQTYANHRIPFGVAKTSLSILFTRPEYIFYLPIYWKNVVWSLKKFQLQQWAIGKVQQLPGVGGIANFIWKSNEYGFLEGPIERLKNKAKTFGYRVLIRGTGNTLKKLGEKLGLKFLQSWGGRLLGMAVGGPLGLAFAFFGGWIKKMTGGALFGLGMIFFWLSHYGAPALIGGGIGFIAGNILGVKAAALVWGTTLPFLGPFAIIPAAITYFGVLLVTTLAGGALGVLLVKLKDALLGSGAASTAPATGLSAAFSAPIVNAAVIAPVTLAGVGALSVYTIMVTSSAFFQPTMDLAALGSPYIDLKKSVDVGGSNSPVIQNSVIGTGQKVVYELVVTAKEQDLNLVSVVDKITVRNKNETVDIPTSKIEKLIVTGKDSSGKYVFGGPVPDVWNDSNIPALKKIPAGSSWTIYYGFKLEDKDLFTDSFVNNFVTVKAIAAGEEQTKNISLSFKIGNPPLPKTAEIALNLIYRLTACYPDPQNPSQAKVNSVNFNTGDCVRDTTKNPVGVSFTEATIRELYQSVNTGDADVLQCIGFVKAILTEAGTPLSPNRNAGGFYGYGGDGFKWYSSSSLPSIKEGDIFIANWSSWGGHAAIVINNYGDRFDMAEALGYLREPPRGQEPDWQGIAHYPSAPYIIDYWQTKNYVGFLRYEP